MDIKGDQLRISTLDRTPDGKQIDPEEHPVDHVIETSIPLAMSSGQSVEAFTGGQAKSELNGSVVTTATAAEVAAGFRGRCKFCRHFDNQGFRRWKHDVDVSGDKDRRGVLNYLRGKILGEGYATAIKKNEAAEGDDVDVEHALMNFGFCKALSSIFKDMVCVWPDAGCPTTDPTGAPFPTQFTPRDAEAEQQATAGYDAILKAAQGGGPKRKATRIFTPKK